MNVQMHRDGLNYTCQFRIIVALWLLLSVSSVSLAQDGSPGVRDWSQPINISQSPGDSADPTMVADNAGTVHLFWSERFEDESDHRGPRIHGNTLMYSHWRNGEWSAPNDVLVSPDEGEIWQPAAAVDKFGVLHIIWASAPGGRLYYSHAAVEQAPSARSWLAPTQLYSGLPTLALPGGVAVDSHGIVHVIATSRDLGQEVVHMSSADGGLSWSSPTSLSSVMPDLPGDSLVSGGVAMHIDAQDNLHVGWTMFNQDGFGVIIYYAQSSDGGVTWSPPFIVGEKAETDYEADWLNIATVGEDRIHLVWTGIGRPPGRVYRTSLDGGETWTPATPFMEGLVGETESPRMVVDSAGAVHLFTPARTVTTDTGVRYSYWTGQDWTTPTKIPGPPPDPGAYPALRLTATVNLGNQIWVAWYDEPKGEVFVTNGESSAPVVAPVPFVVPPQNDDALAQEDLNRTSQPTPTIAISPVPARVLPETTPSDAAQKKINLMTLLIVSILPSTAVVVAVMVGIAAKRRHWR